MRKILGLCLLFSAFAAESRATSITFATPSGSNTGGGPVNSQATFTTSTGQLSIMLTDLQANPTDVAELISDLQFVMSGGITTGTLSSSSGQFLTVLGDGTFTLDGTTSTGWALNQNVGGGLQLDVLGTPIGPAGLIIGPPGPGGVYTNANGSIAGNGPHNPFINQTATFVITNPAITASTTVNSAIFSYGTTEGGALVPGVPVASTVIPEPPTFVLMAGALLFFGALAQTRKSAASRSS